MGCGLVLDTGAPADASTTSDVGTAGGGAADGGTVDGRSADGSRNDGAIATDAGTSDGAASFDARASDASGIDGGCPLPVERCQQYIDEFNPTIPDADDPAQCHIDMTCRFGIYYDECLEAFPDCSWNAEPRSTVEEIPCEDRCTGALPDAGTG